MPSAKRWPIGWSDRWFALLRVPIRLDFLELHLASLSAERLHALASSRWTGRTWIASGLLDADCPSFGDRSNLPCIVNQAVHRLELAHRLGVSHVVLAAGQPRSAPGRSSQEAASDLRRVLVALYSTLTRLGIRLLLEPLSPRETACVHTLREGAEVIDGLPRKQFGLVHDLYHARTTGDDWAAVGRDSKALVDLIHVAGEERTLPRLEVDTWLRRQLELILSSDRLVPLSLEVGADALADVREVHASIASLRTWTENRFYQSRDENVSQH
jgi:hypothetical protein